MTPSHRIAPLALLAAVAAVALTACATPGAGSAADTSALASAQPAPPAGDVIAQGTVMDVAGEIELCLGAVAESYPPQCSGIPLEGWSWDDVDGWESSGEVTWGAYAVPATYDGTTFTVTAPAMLLALYDPMTPEDPTGGEPGAGDEAELAAIQEEIAPILGESFLSSWVRDGWLHVQVVWDDGTLQTAADADYGPGMIVIEPALRTLGG